MNDNKPTKKTMKKVSVKTGGIRNKCPGRIGGKAMKAYALIYMAAFCLFAVSCGGNQTTPEEIATAIYEQQQKGNFEKAAAIYIKHLDRGEGLADEATSRKLLAEGWRQYVEGHDGIKAFRVEDVSPLYLDDDHIEIEVAVTYGDRMINSFTNPFIRENGRWKVCISARGF
jgi:hypothetical protein